LLSSTIVNPNLHDEIDSLVDKAKSGDVNAFGRLYDIHVDRIYRHIHYRIGKTEDARDLTQEVFVKAWQALPKYKKTQTPFLAWLFTISHNRVIDFYRTHKVHNALDNGLDIEDPGKRPEILTEELFSQKELKKVILRLPEDQQQVILMYFIEGMEYKEIAAVLNKTEGNIRVITHRALKKMREILSLAGK
jgi:RNA polymerase sigma-70 factor, ECF subfamily